VILITASLTSRHLQTFMATPQRHSNPINVMAGDRTFFVTSCTWGRRNLLQSDRTASLFMHTLRVYRSAGKFRLHAFVIMPDHFHLPVTVGADMTIERAVQFVKGGFAFRAGKELGQQAPIWQKGFSEIRVSDSKTFQNQRNYVHNNPVIARLADIAEAYPYSSAANPCECDPSPAHLDPVLRSA
jgi:putative transposase